MDDFFIKCKQKVIEHHAKLQKRKIAKITAEVIQDLKKCSNGTDPLKTSLFYIFWNKKIKDFRLFLIKAKQYLKVEVKHATQGPAPQKEIKKRIDLCKGCPGRVDSLEDKTDPGGIGFCSLCGCGASRRAALSVKLTLAGTTCPLSKFSPVKGEEKKWKHTKDAIKGVLYSIIDRIKI